MARDWPRDPELKRAIALIDGLEATLEDFRLADEISARAVERTPSDPETVTVRARVHSAFVTRGFDFSAERSTQAKRFGERAVQLSPDDPQALYALSIYLRDRAGDFARAETLARRACELAPNEPRYGRQLARVLTRLRPEEGVALGEDLVRRFPQDVLVHYELSIAYRDRREWEKFERENDATLALAPLANALNWKARAAGLLHGDFAEMRRALDQVPARVRFEERTVISAIIYAMFGGDYDYGLKSMQGFAEPWFFDVANYAGPAELLQAMLLAQQGKSGLARTQFELALTQLTRHQKENPTDQTARRAETWILLGLGRRDEARALYRTFLESLNRPYRIFAMSSWFGDTIPLGLLVGEREAAVQLIREAATQPEGRKTIRDRMKLDARMAPFRDAPEIAALLAEPKKETAAASTPSKIDPKSVAVLAFDNRSDDKDAEYFSDGISDELNNALGRVPGLTVKGRTSAFSFKGKNATAQEIGEKLGVTYLVRGSVRKAGDKVRITAQLSRAATDEIVWSSEPFTRDLKDIFAVQDEITKNILTAVKGSLMGEAELPHAATTKIEAYTFYLQAQGALAKRGDAGLREAIRLFEAALAVDANYVPALVGLGQARALVPLYANLSGPKARAMIDGSMAAAKRAIELDPRNPGAHAVIGWLLVQYEWKWAEGEAAVLRALELAPNDAWIWNSLGDHYRFIGEFVKGIAAKQRAWELDPLSPTSQWDMSYAHLVAGNLDQALHWSEVSVGLSPHNLDSYTPGIMAACQSGRTELMRKLVTAARQNVHENEGLLLLLEARTAIQEKKPDEARRLLAKATPLAETGDNLTDRVCAGAVVTLKNRWIHHGPKHGGGGNQAPAWKYFIRIQQTSTGQVGWIDPDIENQD